MNMMNRGGEFLASLALFREIAQEVSFYDLYDHSGSGREVGFDAPADAATLQKRRNRGGGEGRPLLADTGRHQLSGKTPAHRPGRGGAEAPPSRGSVQLQRGGHKLLLCGQNPDDPGLFEQNPQGDFVHSPPPFRQDSEHGHAAGLFRKNRGRHIGFL